MITKKIINKYKDKLLGICNYKSDEEDGNFYVDEFTNRMELINFLHELKSHENTLTRAGYAFLEEYYGLNKVAKMLLEENLEYPYDNKEDTIKWLESTKEWSID